MTLLVNGGCRDVCLGDQARHRYAETRLRSAGFTPATLWLHVGYFSAIARMRRGGGPVGRPEFRPGLFAGLVVLGVVRRPTSVPMDEPPVDLDEAMLQPLIQAQGSAALRTSSPRSS